MLPTLKVYVGFSPDEMVATNVALESMRSTVHHADLDLKRISRLTLGDAYTRPTSMKTGGQLWDVISDAPMSTDHSIARFFVSWLCDFKGWALFTDGDVLCRRSLADLFNLRDDRYAVMCVHHAPLLTEGVKKNGDMQVGYPKKNWSSVVLWNAGHPANRVLTPDYINSALGRHLHAFSWLPGDDLIGELPAEWNYLIGLSPGQPNPALVHFTTGTPNMDGHEYDQFADEWWKYVERCGYKIPVRRAVV
jgi:hypothetical protein